LKVFVLEIGRPIRDAVEQQFGYVDDYISVPRAISEIEIPKIAAKAYHKVMNLAKEGDEVAVILSGPLGLAFEFGQAIGLSHAKVIVYQFSQGKYVRVPTITREHLFEVKPSE